MSSNPTGKQSILVQNYNLISGLTLNYVDTATLTVSPGLARDASSAFDMVYPSLQTLSISSVGVNGLDTGAVAASSIYYVYSIADSSSKYSPAFVMSLVSDNPVMPSGYDLYRRIGQIATDGSKHIILFEQMGTSNERVYYYLNGVTALSNGAATSKTSVDISASIPKLNFIEINFQARYSGSSGYAHVYASNSSTTTYTFSDGTYRSFNIISDSNGTVYYDVDSTGLTLTVMGYRDSI
jgi:hypothetical protein